MTAADWQTPPLRRGSGYAGRRSPSPGESGDGGPRSRVAEAYARVKEMIIERNLSAGSVITEAQLTRDLHMSRTPVREALTRLAAEGYLRPSTGRGYVISELTAEDLVNVYTVRAELEGLAAGEAAKRVRRVDLAHLEDLYDDMAAALRDGRDEDLALLNSEFHATIAVVSGNSYLKRMLDDIQNTFDLFRRRALTAPGRREDAHAEHGRLIEALRKSDSELASRLAKLHVERALRIRQSTMPIEGAAEANSLDSGTDADAEAGAPPSGTSGG